MSHRRAKAIRKVLRKRGVEYRNVQAYAFTPGSTVYTSPGRQDYQKLKRGINEL